MCQTPCEGSQEWWRYETRVSLFIGLPGEVLVVDVLWHRDLGDVELCWGGHQVPLVHPPEKRRVKFFSCKFYSEFLSREQLVSAALERMTVVFRKWSQLGRSFDHHLMQVMDLPIEKSSYLSGQPLSLWGPVTRSRPVPSCFSTMTRLPFKSIFMHFPRLFCFQNASSVTSAIARSTRHKRLFCRFCW